MHGVKRVRGGSAGESKEAKGELAPTVQGEVYGRGYPARTTGTCAFTRPASTCGEGREGWRGYMQRSKRGPSKAGR